MAAYKKQHFVCEIPRPSWLVSFVGLVGLVGFLGLIGWVIVLGVFVQLYASSRFYNSELDSLSVGQCFSFRNTWSIRLLFSSFPLFFPRRVSAPYQCIRWPSSPFQPKRTRKWLAAGHNGYTSPLIFQQ